MPATVLATTVVVTRLAASNNFQFLIQNGQGGQRLVFVLLQADMATAAALGNGASSTFTYGQDGNNPTGPGRNDYPNSYTTETGS
jgi:hypothetical protein